ncbi:IPT/TIG domain-containing protein [Niastella populi]|uniref:IPT/TIG domain-containing protein n=1 Tax=Niastella populi TaxID=550983 RepID=A0A1V9EV06_9BACT|nr:IPT/TIG domain-containing protein [Niastella populi]OQP49980.1 hypothetical protein A4R26_30150 [Niastella populi]
MFFAFACSKSGNDAAGPGNPGNPGNPVDPGNNNTLTITGVSPDAAESGTVTIRGTGFNGTANQNEVRFGTFTAPIQSASATQLVVTLPADLPQGDHDITVFANNKFVTKTKGFHLIGWRVYTYAGTGATGGIDGPVAGATFQWPTGMAMDKSGNMYVTDLNRIRKITPQGVVSTIAGTAGRGAVDANGVNARFNSVTSIVPDAAGNLYVADQMNFTIRKIAPNGDVTTFAGKAGDFGYADGTGADARFSMPYGLTINNAGTHLLVGDHNNHVIRQIELATATVTTIAGNGQQTSSDGKGLQAGIPGPGSMAFDTDGNLFITEKGGGRMRKMMPDGTITTIGGSLSLNFMPTHVAIDDDKNVYVTYSGMGKIKKYTPAGVESNFAGNNIGTGEQEGPAQTVFITRPEGIVITKDSNGKMIFYISDAYNKKIKKIVKE